jgi:hypothetical protein
MKKPGIVNKNSLTKMTDPLEQSQPDAKGPRTQQEEFHFATQKHYSWVKA